MFCVRTQIKQEIPNLISTIDKRMQHEKWYCNEKSNKEKEIQNIRRQVKSISTKQESMLLPRLVRIGVLLQPPNVPQPADLSCRFNRELVGANKLTDRQCPASAASSTIAPCSMWFNGTCLSILHTMVAAETALVYTPYVLYHSLLPCAFSTSMPYHAPTTNNPSDS